MNIRWNDQFLKDCKKILNQHTRKELSIALEKISEIAGKEVDEKLLRQGFENHDEPSPFFFLKESRPSKVVKNKPATKGEPVVKDEPEIEDPVAKAERKEESSREKSQIKLLVDELRQARARQSFIDELADNKTPPKIIPREKNSGIRELTAVVLASDWHVEEPVLPESVAYRNEYNLVIAEQRIERFFNGIIWNIEHQRASGRLAINDLVLWLGGDFMSGHIHPELVESSQLSPTEASLWLKPRICDGIFSLLKRLDLAHVEIPCSFGNHGRTTDKPRISTGYANSFEWLMYHSIKDEFKNEKQVHFEITGSPHQYVNVYDRILHFHHGDDIKYQGGVGGLTIPLMKAIPAWDLVKRADIHNIGHFHTLTDFNRAVVNGSLIGYGPYSQRIRAAFEDPTQAMYYVDKVRGKCMTTALWVEDTNSYKASRQAG